MEEIFEIIVGRTEGPSAGIQTKISWKDPWEMLGNRFWSYFCMKCLGNISKKIWKNLWKKKVWIKSEAILDVTFGATLGEKWNFPLFIFFFWKKFQIWKKMTKILIFKRNPLNLYKSPGNPAEFSRNSYRRNLAKLINEIRNDYRKKSWKNYKWQGVLGIIYN